MLAFVNDTLLPNNYYIIDVNFAPNVNTFPRDPSKKACAYVFYEHNPNILRSPGKFMACQTSTEKGTLKQAQTKLEELINQKGSKYFKFGFAMHLN